MQSTKKNTRAGAPPKGAGRVAALRHLPGWILKTLSAAVAAGLAFACLARYISPAATWLFAFFGLIFPQLLLANVALFVFWLLVKRRTLWIHAAVIIPSLFFVPAYVQIRMEKEEGRRENDGKRTTATAHTPHSTLHSPLKIITYNVHLFGINYKNKTLRTLPDIAQFIRKEAPAVVCLQEIAAFDTLAVRKAFGDYPYCHFYLRPQRNRTLYATAILSRYPIVGKGTITLQSAGDVCIYADIPVAGDTVRVYNNHLQSTRLDLAMSFSRLKQDEKRHEEIKEVSVRLRDAFVKRAGQVELVAAHVAAAPYRVVVCGDFNDLPMSYTYRTMKGNLRDAFIEAGAGIPSTFRSRLPAFRIDYIFCDRAFKVTHFYIPKMDCSDHYPVVAIIE
jgi:endonuclease/exonuclease/phosphatase family metal-dependent hydrolase